MSDRKENTSYAYFRIVEFDCSVEDITKRVGIEPTGSYSQGEKLHPKQAPRKYSAWHLKSKSSSTADIETRILELLEQVKGKEFILKTLAEEFGLQLTCVGHFHESNLGLSLSEEIISRVAECGASMDFDFYHYWADASA